MSKIFKNLVFFFMIIKILSIPGQEGFQTIDGIIPRKVSLDESCPCDTTTSCEKGCCCDNDCINFMLDNSFFDENFECDPESSASRIINSKLEYCEDYKKSIDDLYNPLILAFKILKRGFCLFRDNKKEKEEEKNNQNEFEQDEDDKINLDDYNDDDNENFIKVPLALPSGMCLFNSYPIKKLEQDYEVTCTYKNDLEQTEIIESITDQITSIGNEQRYYLEDTSGDILKKMEIFYFDDTKSYDINYYYQKKEDDDVYQDFTFIIKNFDNNKDFHKSGNPGYIKGKPILIGQEGTNSISKFRDDIVFPASEKYKCFEENEAEQDNYFYYYDNYMDNKLTFEDLIFYKYKNPDLLEVLMSELNSDDLKTHSYFGLFGNANPRYEKDWQKIPINVNYDEQKNLLLLGVYIDYGLVNNTQFKIQEFEIQSRKIQENIENYFIMKFLKSDTDSDWWYSPGPGFVIRVPKNWMYPFQIGTTTYRTKN